MSADAVIERYKRSPAGLLVVRPTGSGKTRLALKATREDKRNTVVGTASLTKNFEGEEKKVFKATTPRKVTTYSSVARGNELPGGNNLILDESHYIRNPKTRTAKMLTQERKKYNKALLLTATPIVNEPYDLASQVNLVANREVMPADKKEFYSKYYDSKNVKPGFFGRMLGVKPGAVRELKKRTDLEDTVSQFVDIADKKEVAEFMPKTKHEVVNVPMAEDQSKIYKYLEGKMPFHVRYKIKKGLPPSKSESANLNAYMTGLRQVSNTTAPYVKEGVQPVSSKLDQMVKDMRAELANKGKVITYSNFLGAGSTRIKARLDKKNIQYSEIHGSLTKKQRAAEVEKYTSNKSNVMLFSGAGSEGLNLPKTTMVQITEPHWNEARVYQAASRGVRRGDDPNRTVNIRHYLSTRPESKLNRLGFGKPKKSADQYLYEMSKRKKEESDSMLRALRGKSDAKRTRV